MYSDRRVQRWNGTFFEKTSLKALGLRVQLGHAFNDICMNPICSTNNDFIILHSNGIHEVGLDFCGCGKGNQLQTIQLLRERLFPATVTNPKTAATIEVLNLFSILSYESKMSAFQFYHLLSRLTDNTGVHTPKVSRSHSDFLRKLTFFFRTVIHHFFVWLMNGDISRCSSVSVEDTIRLE